MSLNSVSLNLRLFDGKSWYVTAEYDPETKNVLKVIVPLLTGTWDITDQLNPDQMNEIKENIKKRGMK